MTLAEVDSEIAIWKKTLGAAAQNLMDLHSLPTYQRLTGSNGVPKADISGVTAARVYPALEGMGKLFQNFDDLQSAIDRAAELRQHANSLFGSEAKIREIEALLRGKSVKLIAEPLPIDQRSLSMTAEDVKDVTPAELMSAMARSFTAARDVVLAVNAAWEKLGMALDHAMTELAEFRAQSEQWKANFPALANIENSLETIRGRIETDPLGSAEDFDSSIAPVFNQARSALAKLKAQRAELDRGFLNAAKLLNQLKDLHRESTASWDERRLKVTGLTEPPAPLAEPKLTALADWLERLEEKFREGMIEPILVGLEKWNKSAAEFVSYERACLDANQSPLKERNELRGRLEALKAKARAKGAAEHPELTRLAAEANEHLFARPTPLEKASSLVADYERALRALTT